MAAHLGILLAIVGGSLGQLLMKSGLQTVSFTDIPSVVVGINHYPVPTLLVASGIACYVISMFVWVHTLKNQALNQAIPYLSLSYVLVYFLAALWPGINEPLTLQKSVGVGLIMIGVWYTQRAPDAGSS